MTLVDPITNQPIKVDKMWYKKKGDQNINCFYPAIKLLIARLFQTAYNGSKLTKLPKFSRHKIMHGESIDYGNIENTIRAFMLIDFLDYFSKFSS
jgi:hypothetical protein